MASVQTGTATSNIDLLQKLVTWLISRGWANNKSQIDGSGWRAHLSKGAVYVNFRATVLNEGAWADNSSGAGNANYALHLYCSTGYSSGATFAGQPGGPVQSGTSYAVGVAAVTGSGAITSYQFVDDGSDNIVIIIERSPGVFRRLAWGSLIKYGAWTGGVYFDGSVPGYYGNTQSDLGSYNADPPFAAAGAVGASGSHTSFIRADVDTFLNAWLCCGTNNSGVVGFTGKLGTSGISKASGTIPPDVPNIPSTALVNMHNTLAGRAITMPIVIYGARDAGGFSALGEVPSMRLCAISEVGGASIGSDLTIGAETWRVFPNFLVKVA